MSDQEKSTGRSLHVIMRHVSPAIEKCELTCISREPISLAVCEDQHEEYRRIFTSLTSSSDDDTGFDVKIALLDPLPEFPDSVFVEDTAILFPECAIISNPGAASRRGEVEAIVESVEAIYSAPVHRIAAPGFVDGGDVLVVGKFVFVGQSTRTNAAAVEQLQVILGSFGYTCVPCVVRDCLHLKTAASLLTSNVVLFNPMMIDAEVFMSRGIGAVPVPDPAGEPNSANVLSFRVEKPSGVARRVVAAPTHYPLLKAMLEQYFASSPMDSDAPVSLSFVPASELAKAEGALTCTSLLVLK
jgi:dimethylargininase